MAKHKSKIPKYLIIIFGTLFVLAILAESWKLLIENSRIILIGSGLVLILFSVIFASFRWRKVGKGINRRVKTK